jgi:cellulose biosynthesis protein BcsQ
LKLLLATNHPEIDALVEKLETEKGIKELEKLLKQEGFNRWVKPILIVDHVLYRERLIEKAKAAQPDVVLLYDRLPGTVDLEILLEELRLEIKNSEGKDSRVVFLTSLEQGSTLLRKAVEIGVWDIVSGKDIYPLDVIRRIYQPANYSDAARFRLASDDKSHVRLVPKYVEKEKIVEVPVIKEVKVTEVVEKTEYVRVGNVKGIKETILVWSPFESGKTFLAVNLAAALAGSGFKIVLIDADLKNRALENYFDMQREEKYVFLKAMKNRLNPEEVLGSCHVYKKNLYVLTLPSGKAELPEVTAEDFFFLYDNLRGEADLFVLDGDKNLKSTLAQCALKLSSRILLPVTLDLVRARLLRAALGELTAAGVPLSKLEIVLNMHVKTEAPRKKEIEELLGFKMLPVDIPAVFDTAFKSIYEGVPAFDASGAPGAFVQAVSTLANHLCGGEIKRGKLQAARKRLFGF